MARLAISLLGRFQVCLYDEEAVSLEAGRPGALLAYLAVKAGGAHTRQTLAEMFWPDRSDSEALDSLRFALSNLRAALQDRQAARPILLVDRTQVQLNPQAEVWVDVAAFTQQADDCEAEVRRGASPRLEILKDTLGLYRGDFLQGFNLGDGLAFETWALSKREQLERKRLRLLRLLGAGLEAVGSYPQAEETYRSILAVEPWDEYTHRQLMRLLAVSGQRSAALAQYEACRQALREVGIEPGREANLLYHRIKQEWTASDHAGELEPGSLGEQAAAPIVAREAELGRLEAFLEKALAGQGQVALITGEAGSGKTALMSEFARLALARHPALLVLGGQCDAYTGIGQSYQPFIECLQMLAGEWKPLPWAEHLPAENQERLQRAVPQVAQSLVETAPVLLDRFVDRAELGRSVHALAPGLRPIPTWLRALGKKPSGTVPRLDTGILFEQVTRLLAGIARLYPLVLLLDDLQWTDAGSAALLFHLARRLAGCPILILVAYRPGEISAGREGTEHPLSRCVTEIQRYGGNVRLDLDQVDEQAFVTAFLKNDPQLQPHSLDEAFGTALAQHTGGNPLFTIELLRSLQVRGDVHRAPDGTWVSSPTLNWDHLPARVEATIAGQLTHLTPTWLDWLSTASVEGGSFTVELLAQVHHVEINALLQDLNGPLGMGRGAQRLVQGEAVQWIDVGRGHIQPLSRYRFRHILFQTYLYQQMNPVERSQRHAVVALAFEALYGGQPEECARHAVELARHFEAGGMLERAAGYSLEAGRQAARLASTQVAVEHYRHGLDLLADCPHTPECDHLEISLYLALGAPFISANNWGGPERQRAIQKALELIEEIGQEAAWPELFPALHAQSDWLISQGELEQAARLGEQMLALAGEQESLALALAHLSLGFSSMFQGNFHEARRHLEASLRVYRAIGQPATLSRVGVDLGIFSQSFLGMALAVGGYPDQAWAQSQQALERGRSLAHLPSLGMALLVACEVAGLRRDIPALQALADELLQLGQAEEMRFFRAYGLAAGGYVQSLQAKPGSEQTRAGLEMVRSGMQIWEKTGTRSGRGQWIAWLASACLQAGEIAAGLEVTASELEQTQPRWIQGYLAEIYRLRGELLLRASDPDRREAESCFKRALEISRKQATHTWELRAALSLAKLWQNERPAEARRLLEDTCAWFTEGWEIQDWQEAQALLRTITALLGRGGGDVWFVL